MSSIVSKDAATAATTQIIKQIVNTWTNQAKILTNFFNKYEDAVYLKEVSPGRNRAVYLLGHLISSADGMLPMFGLGERLYPELEAMFSGVPDRSVEVIPTVGELKQYWDKVNTTLLGKFNALQPEEWLERHTRVSAEDFALDPLRNKLNVLISRTVHMGYHLGQLTFLKAD